MGIRCGAMGGYGRDSGETEGRLECDPIRSLCSDTTRRNRLAICVLRCAVYGHSLGRSELFDAHLTATSLRRGSRLLGLLCLLAGGLLAACGGTAPRGTADAVDGTAALRSNSSPPASAVVPEVIPTTGASRASNTPAAPGIEGTTPVAAASAKSSPDVSPPAVASETQSSVVPTTEAVRAYGYTYVRPDGNRTVTGNGDLPRSRPIDVELAGKPTWVTGVTIEGDTAWVVVLEDGRVQAFRLNRQGAIHPWSVTPDRIPPGSPPLARVSGDALELVTLPIALASSPTHPIPIGDGGDLLAVAPDGDGLLLTRDVRPRIMEGLRVRALPDARMVQGERGRIAVLSDPTRRYPHGVLGDELEAEAITILRSRISDAGDRDVRVVGRIEAPRGRVLEALAPLWLRMSSGGEELLAITESSPDEGTRVALYAADGRQVSAGPPIGAGMRWRHLLAAGPFGPGGEIELVATRTPHIGGVVEFYRLHPERRDLEIVATMPGYTSHRIGSRNLDTALGGDLDGDGRWEILVPDQSYSRLAAIRHDEGGARVVWTLPVGSTLATNLAPATGSDGRIVLAAGTSEGMLRVWR